MTALAGEPAEEGEHASRGDVALGKEDDGDDQHHQEVNEQGAERAGLLSKPADRAADVGLDPVGEGTGRCSGEVVPGPGEAGAEGDGVDPGRRRRDLERGERARQLDEPVRLLDDRVHGKPDRDDDDGQEDERHHADRRGAPAAEAGLESPEQGPGGDDDGHRPDSRTDEGADHPEAAEQQSADCQDPHHGTWKVDRCPHGVLPRVRAAV